MKQAFKVVGKETIFKSKIKDGNLLKKIRIEVEIVAKTETDTDG